MNYIQLAARAWRPGMHRYCSKLEQNMSSRWNFQLRDMFRKHSLPDCCSNLLKKVDSA